MAFKFICQKCGATIKEIEYTLTRYDKAMWKLKAFVTEIRSKYTRVTCPGCNREITEKDLPHQKVLIAPLKAQV